MNKAIRLFIVVILIGPGAGALRADQPSPYEKQLAQKNITIDADGLGGYLRGLHPDESAVREAKNLIQQLGDNDFSSRETAMKKLLDMPATFPNLLRAAAEGEDPEIRWRAITIRELSLQRRVGTLYAIFSVIADKEIKGLAREVYEAIPHCPGAWIRRKAQDALQATMLPENAGQIAEAARSEDAHLRVAALTALEKLLSEKADDVLVEALKDQQPLVKLAAAKGLLNHGNRAGIEPLVELLESDSTIARLRSAQTLRFVSGKRFSFAASAPAVDRKTALVAWQSWAQNESAAAELKYPLSSKVPLLGRTLISYMNANKVVELDASGKVIWTKSGLSYPWGCRGLPNGNRLISWYRNSQVAEYDAEGKEVWKLSTSGRPSISLRLENGNTLVLINNQQLVEFKPDKTEAWKKQLSGQFYNVSITESGTILLAGYSHNKVLEIDREGKEIWSTTKFQHPFSAQRLENGNTLIAQYGVGKVVEISPDEKVVWEKSGLPNPRSAQRLENGNTLVVTSSNVQEIDPKGKVVWQRDEANPTEVHRY